MITATKAIMKKHGSIAIQEIKYPASIATKMRDTITIAKIVRWLLSRKNDDKIAVTMIARKTS